MYLLIFSALIAIIITILYFVDSKGIVSARYIINHFWFFTFLWIIFFPLRAILIYFDVVDQQIKTYFSESELFIALIVSFCLWITSFLGYNSLSVQRIKINPVMPSSFTRLNGIFVFLVIACFSFIYIVLFENGKLIQFTGNAQNEARTGNGPLFLLSTLYLMIFYFISSRELCVQNLKNVNQRNSTWYIIILVIVVFLSLILSVLLNSRRILAEPLLCFALVYFLRGKQRISFAVFIIFAPVLFSPVLQVLRYMDFTVLMTSGFSSAFSINHLFDIRYFMTILSSSFEGIDHLAMYLRSISLAGFLIGFDAGVSWIYNFLLALVPREIWVNKPEIYGSVAQQFHLYPQMYKDGAATTTIPVSYATDFIYGFGIWMALLLSYIWGRVLKLLTFALWNSHLSFLLTGISLFVFVNMFNFLRAGSGFLQSIVILMCIAIMISGFIPTMNILKVFMQNLLRIRRRKVVDALERD